MEKMATGYERKILFSDESFEIVECTWEAGGYSPQHDHGWSQCVVVIQEGEFENCVDLLSKSELSIHRAGEVIKTPLGARHGLKCVSPNGGKTLHYYSPRIGTKKSEFGFHPTSLFEVRNFINPTLSDSGIGWEALAGSLQKVLAASLPTHSPYFMNQLFSGVLPSTLLASEVAQLSRTTLATFEASPAFTAIELEVVQKLGELIGWPEGQREGIGIPGGSAGNFMALHCARQHKDPSAKKKGVAQAKFKVFASQESHYSLAKACAALGLGIEALTLVACDAEGRMEPAALEQAIRMTREQGALPLMVCATAGTTVFGAFDPFSELGRICARENIWFHVDAAWGGPMLFKTRDTSLMRGVNLADSLSFDAHKLLGSGLTCSFFLTRHPQTLLNANDVSGTEYLFHSGEVIQDRGRLSWQCGRGTEVLSFWALWKHLGTQGIGAFVNRLLGVREEVVSWIRNQPRIEVLHSPEFLNICLRIQSPDPNLTSAEWTKIVREKLRSEDVAIVNYSSDLDGPFLRFIVSHPGHDARHFQTVLETALRYQKEVPSESPLALSV